MSETTIGCPTFAVSLFLPLRWDIYNHGSLEFSFFIKSFIAFYRLRFLPPSRSPK
jgi:hypothetical protein